MNERHLGSANHMIWEYYESLKRQAIRTTTCAERELNQEVALTIILAVTVIEIFLNGYLRVVVSETPYQPHEKQFLKDVDKRISLERKCREWPKRILGAELDEANEHMKAFTDLKGLRNELVHFASSHESIKLPGNVTIHGMADTTTYRALRVKDALTSLSTVKGFAYEIFRLRGLPPEQFPHAFHAWFGEVPSNNAFQPTTPLRGGSLADARRG